MCHHAWLVSLNLNVFIFPCNLVIWVFYILFCFLLPSPPHFLSLVWDGVSQWNSPSYLCNPPSTVAFSFLLFLILFLHPRQRFVSLHFSQSPTSPHPPSTLLPLFLLRYRQASHGSQPAMVYQAAGKAGTPSSTKVEQGNPAGRVGPQTWSQSQRHSLLSLPGVPQLYIDYVIYWLWLSDWAAV